MAEITPQNPLGLSSITQHNAKGLAEDYKNRIFHMDWVFNKSYEKLFLVAMLFWSVYSLWRIFF